MTTTTKFALAALSLLLLSSSVWARPVTGSVPDAGSSAALLVLALAGVTSCRRFFKK